MINPTGSTNFTSLTPFRQQTQSPFLRHTQGPTFLSPARINFPGNRWPGNVNWNNNFVNSPAIQNVTQMRTYATNLRDTLQTLSQADTFNRQTVTSSNTGALTINSGANPASGLAPIEVEILQVATGQVNTGVSLSATAIDPDITGTQTFEIEIDGNVHTLSFDAQLTANNRTIQQQMANAINSANLGITANVQSGAGGTSALNIVSGTTGSAAATQFNIRDVGSGNIVSQLGVQNITQAAQDAIFTVNGETRTSATNNVTLAPNLGVTLREATTSPVTVTSTTDPDFAANQIRDMVNSFNSLMGIARDNFATNPRLQNDLMGILNVSGGALGRMGINVGRDGTLSINQAELESALTPVVTGARSRAELFFSETGPNSFGGRLTAVANRAVNTPAQYAPTTSAEPPSGGFNFWGADESDVVNLFANRPGGNLMVQRWQNMFVRGALLDMFF